MIETVAKVSMGVLLIAAAPVDAGLPELWANWGLAGVVVSYVMYRDWQREKRMGAAIDRQEAWMRATLVETLQHNAAAMEHMAETVDACHRHCASDISRAPTRRLHTIPDHQVESLHDEHG